MEEFDAAIANLQEHGVPFKMEPFAAVTGYERTEWIEEPDYPQTNFEQRFLSQGLPIYRARLRKV